MKSKKLKANDGLAWGDFKTLPFSESFVIMQTAFNQCILAQSWNTHRYTHFRIFKGKYEIVTNTISQSWKFNPGYNFRNHLFVVFSVGGIYVSHMFICPVALIPFCGTQNIFKIYWNFSVYKGEKLYPRVGEEVGEKKEGKVILFPLMGSLFLQCYTFC